MKSEKVIKKELEDNVERAKDIDEKLMSGMIVECYARFLVLKLNELNIVISTLGGILEEGGE